MRSADNGSGPRLALTLVVHSFVFAATGISVIVVPLLPRLAERYHATSLAIGLSLTVPSLVMVLLSVPFGAVADKFGARRIAIAGAGLVAVGTVLQGFAPSLPIFLVARAIFAIGWTTSWVSGPTLLIEEARVFGGRPGLGALEVTAGAAFVIGPVFGALLFSIGRAAPFVFAGAAAGVVCLCLTRVPKFETHRGAGAGTSHASWIRTAARGPAVKGATLALICAGFATSVINLVVPVGLHSDGANSAQIGLAFSAAAGLYIVGSAATVRFIATFATVAALAAGMGALAVTAVPAACSLSALAIVVTLMFHTAIRGGLMGAAFSLIASDEEGGSGAAVGLLNMSFAGASAVGPVAAGLLLQTGSVRPAFAAVTGVAVIGTVALSRIARQIRVHAHAGVPTEVAS
jgi:DHA1 family multidrug resistance protein-like MFS transporter